jgi:hypothetical protein
LRLFLADKVPDDFKEIPLNPRSTISNLHYEPFKTQRSTKDPAQIETPPMACDGLNDPNEKGREAPGTF